ncbi:LytTR family DNA-binding domain-containing protein [Pedobacter sp. PLR]|uniref:LytR/AlgR family response regulator transcription factor n=1 Tax=Pedobacter sp. PLR TaxID=2994465 RepID=UPI002246B7ED|nr:LytTR family DNA-binding domain-containing protein [Pedobacter sp. PLR]MCX2452850.1 LytTR family DNA-binding domain-containing protein [Pedobacter sp. PLR]
MSEYIRCLVVDNEPLNLEIMESFIGKVDYLKFEGKCENAFEAIDFLQKNEIDLLFSDIQMPKINGLEMVQSLANPPAIIFATAFGEYALDGFDIGIVDYLLKPISFSRFLKACNKAKLQIEQSRVKGSSSSPSNENGHLFIKENDKLTKVLFTDILYVEAMGDYVKVITKTATLVTYSTFKGFEERLQHKKFVRTHKSFIVQINAIKTITGNIVVLEDDSAIPISKNYRESFLAVVTEG